MHFLSAMLSGVDHDPKAPFGVGCGTLLKGQLWHQGRDAPQKRYVLWVLQIGLGHGRNVRFGDDQEMDRRPRVDVVKGQDILVFVDFFTGDGAFNDFAKNAAGIFDDVHGDFKKRGFQFDKTQASLCIAFLNAFSSKPLKPSRLDNSWSTSWVLKPK